MSHYLAEQRLYDEYLEFIITNSGLHLTDQHDVSVGELTGTVMDLEVIEGGDGCEGWSGVDILVGVEPAHGVWGIASEPGRTAGRLFILDKDSSPFVIEIEDVQAGSDYADGSEWLDAAEQIVNSFDFGT